MVRGLGALTTINLVIVRLPLEACTKMIAPSFKLLNIKTLHSSALAWVRSFQEFSSGEAIVSTMFATILPTKSRGLRLALGSAKTLAYLRVTKQLVDKDIRIMPLLE